METGTEWVPEPPAIPWPSTPPPHPHPLGRPPHRVAPGVRLCVCVCVCVSVCVCVCACVRVPASVPVRHAPLALPGELHVNELAQLFVEEGPGDD